MRPEDLKTMKAPVPANEKRRLKVLWQYEILDTVPEEIFDDLTDLAARICGAPMAMISLVDEDRQWFKSKVGLTQNETAREISFCAHAILQRDLFIVPDAAKDARFTDSPLVTAEPHVRFYAGAPLVTADGHALGTLCVMDKVPRELDANQQQALRVLARHVVSQLELRRRSRELADARKEGDGIKAELRRARTELAAARRQRSKREGQSAKAPRKAARESSSTKAARRR